VVARLCGLPARWPGPADHFEGMTALEARKAVVERLRAEGRIARTEQYVHDVPFSQRSGERIEPLVSLQWFMRMDELAAPAIEVVESGRVQIHPENQRRRYLEWMQSIRPWCISRQLWWGHRIPVWYRGAETYVGMEPPAGDGWERDPDVLDTWFSSGLWPFSTLGWPHDTEDLRYWYPTSVMETGYDIIFFWVARMIFFGIEFMDEPPFHTVYFNGTVRDEHGARMSKTKGNVIDPTEVTETYGSDALRFALITAGATGADLKLSLQRVEANRNFAN
jgi:valyl-tRNA synthetase